MTIFDLCCCDQSSKFDWTLIASLVGPVILAMIGGFVALRQVKFNIISKARIDWTERLRKIISDYVVAIGMLRAKTDDYIEKIKNESKDEVLDIVHQEALDLMIKVSRLCLLIQLNLNSNKSKHKEFETLIWEVNRQVPSLVKNEKKAREASKKIHNSLSKIVGLSKEIFVEQWEKSKKLI